MRLTLIIILLIISTTFLFADTIYLPPDCKEVKSATISTGGGKSIVLYAKVLCQMKDNSYKLFLCKKITVSSLFKFTRFVLPDFIDFKYNSKLHDKIEWR